MRSRLWVAACLTLVLAPAGAFAQCGCDNPVCLNDCVGYGCLCDMPPPPDCTCGLPYCFGMGCLCGVGLCECPGLGQECMYCNSGCPSPDPRCTGEVACCSPDGCGNEQDCFCDSTYCENDGPMCCMGGQKIVCHEAGCQGGNCAVQQPPACANACTEGNDCGCGMPDMCMCEGAWDKNCNDFCGLPPCGGARVCKTDGCGATSCGCGVCSPCQCTSDCGSECGCGPYYCKAYTIPSNVKPYPCACFQCSSFLSCPCSTAGECGQSACVCNCTDYFSCVCADPGGCGSQSCIEPEPD